MVLVMFLFLCGFQFLYYEAFRRALFLVPCSHVVVFSVLFSIMIASLREERAGLYASRAFVR